MADNQDWMLSLRRHRAQFKAHHEAWFNGRLKEFMAAEPVHGAIVNDTEWSILFAFIIVYMGAALLLVAMLDLENDCFQRSLFFTLLELGAPAVHFGVRLYMTHQQDRVAAYVRFNEWLQRRA